MQIITDSDDRFSKLYNSIYIQMIRETDSEIIGHWKHYQLHIKKSQDEPWIGATVCEDILRQRENYYLDQKYPKDS